LALALDGEELAVNSSLNPIAFAMRHPVSVVAALAVASAFAVERMAVDVFPALDLPVIYIAQPYGGMDPSQMESQITSDYEGHSIYMTGNHHVESKNIQGTADIKLDTGTYVQPPAGNSTVAAPLFEIVRTDQVRIFVDVPEADASLVKDGGPARVVVQALGDREFPGRVTRSSWLLDDRTRTMRTEVDLLNTEGILKPGMYAAARIPVSRPETLTLPTSSVFRQDDQAWVEGRRMS
jgi:multidrug efflux pump subunit AcrA (membrane-fusion protein)